MEIVPEEAARVRYIFELYASSKGLKAIANQINHEGYRTKKGNEFSAVGVSDILRNPAYVGKIRYNQREGWSTKRRRGTNKNHIIVDGNHEPIVERELWDKVQSLYALPGGKSPRALTSQYLLTGIMRCPQCGYGMVAHQNTKKRKDGTTVKRRYYVCGQFHTKGSAVCRSNVVNAEYAEEFVLDRLHSVLTKPSIFVTSYDGSTRSGPPEPSL